jgi:signal transduction histidine kinase
MPGWSAPFLILLPLGLFGTGLRLARIRADAAAEHALLLEREQAAATASAVESERARIARELHDIVSHHVSVMTIQAGAAGKVLATRPDLARDAISAVEASGREAMGELRHLLGVFSARSERSEPRGANTDIFADSGPDAEPLRPQPGLGQLSALVEKVRGAGQPVVVDAEPMVLPRGVDLAAYRVVQEGLTNALRYAPGAPTEVRIRRDGDLLIIDVVDDGSAGAAAIPSGAGTGLFGLAERLRLYRGVLQAGPRPEGGFRVHVQIPVELS